MRRALILLLASGVVGSLITPAHAHFKAHEDGDDAPGADIARVDIWETNERRILNTDLSLHEGKRSYARYRFFFDSRGDTAADYLLDIHWDGASGGIYDANLLRADGSDTGARVWVDGTSDYSWFPVSFRSWRLHATHHVRWRVVASEFDYGQKPGLDRAPDSGWYQH